MRCLSSSGPLALALLLTGCAAAPPPPPPPPPPHKVKRVDKPQRQGRAARSLVVKRVDKPQRRGRASRPLVVKRPPAPPVLAAEPLSGVKTIALHAKHSCALLKDGRVACWGDNRDGRILGRGELKVSAPQIIAGVSGARQITVGHNFACALRDGDRLTCWGKMDGVFGSGMHSVRVDKAVALASRGRYVHALRSDGALWCFGAAHTCRHPEGADERLPQLREGLARAEQVSGFYYKGCATLRDGGVSCWGLGSWTPRRVAVLSEASSVEVAGGYACSVGRDSRVYCMGVGHFLSGALHLTGASRTPGSNLKDKKPLRGLSSIVQLAMGAMHLCALSSQGQVYCLGKNRYGQLSGYATNRRKWQPRRVEGIDSAVAIAAGELHTCALLRDETVRCWGDNKYGQLGTPPGTMSYNASFVAAASEPAPPAQLASGSGASSTP